MKTAETRILVVDDESSICSIIADCLSPENYEVITMTDPLEAIHWLSDNRVDLVLTDIKMGEHSGIEVLDCVREKQSDAIVILMTAHPTIESAVSVLKKGAYDFLVKPFSLEFLKATIKRGLAHQRVLRENMRLKEQVEFLRIASAGVSGMEIERYLDMVVRSCRRELSASAAAILIADPVTHEIEHAIVEGDNEPCRMVVSDGDTIRVALETEPGRAIVSVKAGLGEQGSMIFVSHPILIRGKLHGVINAVVAEKLGMVTPGQLDILTILATTAASAIENERLYDDLNRSYIQAIRALANSIEARDKYTAGHTDRVSRLAESIAHDLGWNSKQIDDLIMGCTLHDIGKIGVPDMILNKAGKLTPEETAKMNEHPDLGLKIIAGIELFHPAIPYIHSHHERWDGKGYPRGLSGEDIPLEGRLLAVADTFDAIMSDRPYRKGATLAHALRELLDNRDIQFDRKIVDVFVGLVRKQAINLRELYGRDLVVNADFWKDASTVLTESPRPTETVSA
jgi:response regulator RpfG family c-di-GMP phosphodiesterase